MNNIKQIIRDIQTKTGFSLRKIAKATSIDRRDIQRYLKCTQKPRSKNKQRLIDFLSNYKIESQKEISESNEQDFIALYFRNKK